MRRALLPVGLAGAFAAAGALWAAGSGAEPAGVPSGPSAAGRSGAAEPARADPSAPTAQEVRSAYDGRYQFARIRYDVPGGRGFGRGREPMWAHDFPRAETNFLKILDETTFIRTRLDGLNILTLDDPDLFSYPVAYVVEVQAWNPSDEEIARLGEYLAKGGFLIVDDSRGRRALDNLEYVLARAVPGSRLVILEQDHEIFDSFFRIIPDDVIPPYGNEPPLWLALFEDNDPERRIQVMVNFNNDIGDYWEFSDYGYYPIDLSNEAYKLGVNYIVYAYTH